MKRIAKWVTAIALFVLVIDWGVIGLKIFDGDYDIIVGIYIGLVSWLIAIIGILYIRFANRCQNCGRMIQFGGKYCSHCGKEIK